MQRGDLPVKIIAPGGRRDYIIYMKREWGWVVVALLIICGPTLGQRRAEVAQGTYSQNGVLIGLANLAPLRECSIEAFVGKVRAVKEQGGTVRFDLKAGRERRSFRFPLGRLDTAERKNYPKDFLHKGLKLRSTGYSCGGPEEPLEAISIDRVY